MRVCKNSRHVSILPFHHARSVHGIGKHQADQNDAQEEYEHPADTIGEVSAPWINWAVVFDCHRWRVVLFFHSVSIYN